MSAHVNNRVCVSNLSFHTSELVLADVFSRAGEVIDAKLVRIRETGQSRGFAFVSMATEVAARRAIVELNGAELDGRRLSVTAAEDLRPHGKGGAGSW